MVQRARDRLPRPPAQPIVGVAPDLEFIHANHIPFIEGSVIKYVCRHRLKDGRQDLEKAIHLLELLIELEYTKTAEQLAKAS